MIHRMDPPLDPGRRAAARVRSRRCSRAPASCRRGDGLALRGQVGRRARARCAPSPAALTLSARSGSGHHRRAIRSSRALNRALHEHAAILDGEIVAFDARGPPELPGAPAAHARRARGARAATRGRGPRHLRGLRPAVARRPLADRPPLRRAPRAARRRWRSNGRTGRRPSVHAATARRCSRRPARWGSRASSPSALDSPLRAGPPQQRLGQGQDRRTATSRSAAGCRARAAPGRIGALLVGEPGDDGRLRYAGRVGTGFTERQLDDLRGAARAAASGTARRSRPPAARAAAPRARTGSSRACVAEVVIHRALEGRRAAPPGLARAARRCPAHARARRRAPADGQGARATARIGGRAIPVTNLDKVLYPAGRHRPSGDAIDYAARSRRCWCRTCAGRALTAQALPERRRAAGVLREARARRTARTGSQTDAVPLRQRDDRVRRRRRRATLVWLAQLAALELHPSLALAAEPGRPTAVVFDLDPGAAGDDRRVLPRRAAAARDVRRPRAALRAKSSGSKGLQLYMPLNPRTRRSTRPRPSPRPSPSCSRRGAGARRRRRRPRPPRKGKVLIDWSQNDRAKTTVAVYSLRAREQPTVSTPLALGRGRGVRRVRRPRAAALHGGAGARPRDRARRSLRPRAERQPAAAGLITGSRSPASSCSATRRVALAPGAAVVDERRREVDVVRRAGPR